MQRMKHHINSTKKAAYHLPINVAHRDRTFYRGSFVTEGQLGVSSSSDPKPLKSHFDLNKNTKYRDQVVDFVKLLLAPKREYIESATLADERNHKNLLGYCNVPLSSFEIALKKVLKAKGARVKE